MFLRLYLHAQFDTVSMQESCSRTEQGLLKVSSYIELY